MYKVMELPFAFFHDIYCPIRPNSFGSLPALREGKKVGNQAF